MYYGRLIIPSNYFKEIILPTERLFNKLQNIKFGVPIKTQMWSPSDQLKFTQKGKEIEGSH